MAIPAETAAWHLVRALQLAFDHPPVGVTLIVGQARPRSTRPHPEPESDTMAQLSTQEEFDVRLTNIRGSRGRATSFDGVPAWTVAPDGIVELATAPDGLSAIVRSADALGEAVVTVTGDARQGEEVVPLVGILAVAVTQPDVEVFEIEAGAARARTEGAPPAEEPAPETPAA